MIEKHGHPKAVQCFKAHILQESVDEIFKHRPTWSVSPVFKTWHKNYYEDTLQGEFDKQGKEDGRVLIISEQGVIDLSCWKAGKYHGQIVRFYVDGSKTEG